MKYILDCISDTHTQHSVLKFPEPALEDDDVWILIHAGDFSHHGKKHEVYGFDLWLGYQPQHHKVVIAGNHELLMDQARYDADNSFREALERQNVEMTPHSMISGYQVHYLLNSGVEIEGLRIWGSPYSPRFFDWGFQTDDHTAKALWDTIPEGTQVTVIHGPPKGKGDGCPDMNNRKKTVHVGCPRLLARLKAVKPLLNVSGHIHEGFGVEEEAGTTYVNAAILNGQYKPHGKFVRCVIENNVVTSQVIDYA